MLTLNCGRTTEEIKLSQQISIFDLMPTPPPKEEQVGFIMSIHPDRPRLWFAKHELRQAEIVCHHKGSNEMVLTLSTGKFFFLEDTEHNLKILKENI